jgi:hypothetical protein
MVPCPKCKGGCDVCGGRGQVHEGVARVYAREEGRATTKIPSGYAARFDWPSEVTTRPDVIRKADRRRVILIGLLVVIATAFLLAIVLTLRA